MSLLGNISFVSTFFLELKIALSFVSTFFLELKIALSFVSTFFLELKIAFISCFFTYKIIEI